MRGGLQGRLTCGSDANGCENGCEEDCDAEDTDDTWAEEEEEGGGGGTGGGPTARQHATLPSMHASCAS